MIKKLDKSKIKWYIYIVKQIHIIRRNGMAKKSSNSELITALLYILVGIVLAALGGEVLGWAMTIAGALFIIFGVLELMKNNMLAGVVSLVIGIAIILGGWFLIELVLIVLGVLVAIKGIIALLAALRARKRKTVDVIFALLTIASGILLAFGNAADIIVRIGGVLLIVNGALEILGKGLSRK